MEETVSFEFPGESSLQVRWHDELIAFGLGIPKSASFATRDCGTARLRHESFPELRRDPELARVFYDAGPGRTLKNLSGILTSRLAAELAFVNPTAAAEILLGMWQGISGYQLMLGIDHKAVSESIPKRVIAGVDLFLKAYSP